MKEITIKLYTFDELDEDVQKELVKKYRDEELEYCFPMSKYMHRRIKELIGKTLLVRWCLPEWTEGKLCFTGSIKADEIKNLPFSQFVKDMENTIIKIIPERRIKDNYGVVIRIDTGNASYTDEEFDKLQKAVNSWYETIVNTLKEEGYKCIEELESDEYIKNRLRATCTYYTADGEEV